MKAFSKVAICVSGLAVMTLLTGCLENGTTGQSQDSAASESVPGCNSHGLSDQHNPHCLPSPSPTPVGFQANNRVAVPFGLGFVMTPSMAVQSDGKILYAGGSGTASSQLELARYNSDGTLDLSFGTNGFVLADYGGNSYFYGIAVQPDGKIVATGASYSWDSIIVRFNPNGSLDTSFPVIDMQGNNNQGFYFPTIQLDGKILAMNQYQIYRFNPNGTADSGFAGVGHTSSYVSALTLQSDQKIVACGSTNYWSGAGQQVGTWSNAFTTVMRLNTDGSPDNSFGNSGTIPAPLFGANPCQAITVQPDGKILIGGSFWYANSGDPNTLNPNLIYVIRLNSDGSLDSSFAAGGTLIYSMHKANYNQSVTSLLTLTNGNIFVAGSSGTLELTSSGAIDDSYSNPILAGSQNGLAAAALLPSGKIVMNWMWSGSGYIYSIEP